MQAGDHVYRRHCQKDRQFRISLVGFITGGLGAITILACMFFGALCGSGMATTAAIGGMMIPQMKDKGYNLPYAATLVCFGGTVGPIIPPSLSFVLYGATTKVPVPTLFLAGILPGILMGVGFLATNYVMCRKMGQDVAIHTAATRANLSEAMMERGKQVWKTFREGFWALLSPVIILGGIYSGISRPRRPPAFPLSIPSLSACSCTRNWIGKACTRRSWPLRSSTVSLLSFWDIPRYFPHS